MPQPLLVCPTFPAIHSQVFGDSLLSMKGYHAHVLSSNQLNPCSIRTKPHLPQPTPNAITFNIYPSNRIGVLGLNKSTLIRKSSLGEGISSERLRLGFQILQRRAL
jgi:hypothetical protein